MMTCLETTFLIDLLRGDKEIGKLRKELEAETSLTVAAPSIMEIWLGALLDKKSESEKTKINELISSIIVLPLEEKASKEAAEIEAGLIERGERIEIDDVLIAAIAKTNGETLVTRDEHYARIPGLKMLKY